MVSSGNEPILRTESKDALQSFIYGLGLAYAVLPEGLFKSLEKALGEQGKLGFAEKIGEVLIRLKFTNEEQILHALAKQMGISIEHIKIK